MPLSSASIALACAIAATQSSTGDAADGISRGLAVAEQMQSLTRTSTDRIGLAEEFSSTFRAVEGKAWPVKDQRGSGLWMLTSSTSSTAEASYQFVHYGRMPAVSSVEHQLLQFGSWHDNWDGEGAQAPDPQSRAHALAFARALPPEFLELHSALHVDGRVILERDSAGVYDEAIFNPDGSIILWSKDPGRAGTSSHVTQDEFRNRLIA